MKIKAVETILKTAKTLIVYRGGSSGQWLSDGSAIYPIHNLPELTDKHLFAMFDIPEDKQSKYMFKEKPLPSSVDFGDINKNEKLIQRGRITFCVLGRELEPLKTSHGTIFINTKYLKPFSGEELGYELYERRSASGDIYIVAKSGMLLIGVIMPFAINGEKFIDELEEITLGCRRAPENDVAGNAQLTMEG